MQHQVHRTTWEQARHETEGDEDPDDLPGAACLLCSGARDVDGRVKMGENSDASQWSLTSDYMKPVTF